MWSDARGMTSTRLTLGRTVGSFGRTMSTPFEEIHNLNVASWKAYVAWERELLTFSNELIEELCAQLDWDKSALRRVHFDAKSLDGDARVCPGGFSDGSGYHFALRFELANLWAQRHFTVLRGSEKGAYVVKSAGLETVVSLADRSTVEPLVAALVTQLREMVLSHSLASVTGFTG